jgi:nucleoside-diphosphate-sugar epimerase
MRQTGAPMTSFETVSDSNRSPVRARSVFVTGADGFVGRAVCERLLAAGWAVTAGVRTEQRPVVAGATRCATGPIESADWARRLAGHAAVIHLAARVPGGPFAGRAAQAAYRLVNTEATTRLAQAAAAAGVTRLVFASSIKVFGEPDTAAALTEASPARADDPYGISKHEAERALQAVAAATGLGVTVVRPPVVYGPGMQGNLLRLMRLIERGLPLPFEGVANRRSLVSVWNLADLIACCVEHPSAIGRTFVAADHPPLSTPELVHTLAHALGTRARLFRSPPVLWRMLARAPALGGAVRRLTGSLVVDAALARERLGWQPPMSAAEGFARTASWYRNRSQPAVARKVATPA